MASRYKPLFEVAAGGMGTVYVGTVKGALGFRQLVAIKKPHPHLLQDADYRRELVTEARLASLIRHAHVVDVRDVVAEENDVALVMDYIEGASLGQLLVAASTGTRRVAASAVVRIVLDALAGLHAAHEVTDERGRKVGLIHRDISPQNILVGTDGTNQDNTGMTGKTGLTDGTGNAHTGPTGDTRGTLTDGRGHTGKTGNTGTLTDGGGDTGKTGNTATVTDGDGHTGPTGDTYATETAATEFTGVTGNTWNCTDGDGGTGPEGDTGSVTDGSGQVHTGATGNTVTATDGGA